MPIEDELKQALRERDEARAFREGHPAMCCGACHEAIEKAEAEAQALREQLNKERACHDCREYRAMRDAEVQVLREQLAELQADLPHCSRCGVVLNCDGTDKEHEGALRARVEKLEMALRGAVLATSDWRVAAEALLSESEQPLTKP